MQGITRSDRELLNAQALVGELVPEGSVFAFLAEHRHELFPDSFISDLLSSSTGRPSLPADLVGSVLVLKELLDLSDPQTAEAVKFDIRWKVACGRSLTQMSFDPSTLVYWRKRIAKSERPDRVFDAVAAMRKVARVVPGAAAVIERVARLDYSKPGKPPIDWDDPEAKQNLVSDLVGDALAVLAELCGEARERDEAAAAALGLLALMAGQDVEPAEGSDGTDGRWRIACKVAKDRVISTVDPETRHTRKSKANRKDGFRGHVAAEPETGLVTDAEMTKASADAGSDPVAGEAMIARDHFHRVEGKTACPGPAGADRAPGSEPAAEDQVSAASAEPVSETVTADTDSVDSPGSGPDAPPAAAGGDQVSAAPRADSDSAPRTGADRETTADLPRCDVAGQHTGSGLQVYGDSAYGTGAARAAYRAAGHDTVIKPKPLRPAVPGGFTLRLRNQRADRHGHLPGRAHPADEPQTVVTFGALCAGCPLRDRTTTATDGRSMSIHPHEDLLRAARAQARTPEFKQDYSTRSNIERIIAFTATQRRRRVTLHYHGVTKNHAWLRNRCAAINLRTLLGHGLTRRDGGWALA